MNQNAFFDDMILFYLYKHKTISTLETENTFGGTFDWQNVNNVISNRFNRTSNIFKGYMKYDEDKQQLTITRSGKNYVENLYSERRT